MLNVENSTSLAIHITDLCNLNCVGCYNHKNNHDNEISIKTVELALNKIDPKTVIFFGGEAILKEKLVRELLEVCKGLQTVIHTSGANFNKTNKDIWDRVDRIGMTIDSLNYDWLRRSKRFTIENYKSFILMLSEYSCKISSVHNIYPFNNDRNFLRDIEKYNIQLDSYPYITKYRSQQFLSYFRDIIKINDEIPLMNKPKLRILVNGAVTRDMRGIYNIAPIEKFNINNIEEYKNNELPVNNKCKQCKLFKKCFACRVFPAFVYDVLNEIDFEPHFCKFTKIYWRQL